MLQSSGVEDFATNEGDYAYDQWPVVEAGAGTLDLSFDTVYNATVPVTLDQGSGNQIYAHTDGVWVPASCGSTTLTGNTVSLNSTVVRVQPHASPASYGADIDTGQAVTATDSAYTTVATIGSGSATAPGTAGVIPGDPGFAERGRGRPLARPRICSGGRR
ncbi:MAG TPA: hypothetical protein VMU66_11035 [Gaiellales bacterium]|nr:hypothetical protein [Gaiellales bacterium]